MLTLLRRLRKKLLDEGQLRKYLVYATGEILLVTIGILLALQVNNLNNNRLDRLKESSILQRLAVDLEEGITSLSGFIDDLETKEQALVRVTSVFNGAPIPDTLSFLKDVLHAGYFGWGQPSVNRTSFEEVVSSGQLGLISNTALRSSLVSFYYGVEDDYKRASLRVSEYTKTAYALIPRSGSYRALKIEVSANEYRSIVTAVKDSDLRRYITFEQNRARFLNLIWSRIRTDAEVLLNQIKAE